MGISNLVLKIRSAVKFWPFLLMRSRKKWLKMPEIVVQFPKFLVLQEIGHGEVKFRVDFFHRK